MEDETKPKTPLLTDEDLLKRWSNILPYDDPTAEKFKKFMYRLRSKKGKAKLKSVPLGKKRGYHPDEVAEWERNNSHNFLLALANRTNKPVFRKIAAKSNDQDEHDPNDIRWFHDFLSGKVNE